MSEKKVTLNELVHDMEFRLVVCENEYTGECYFSLRDETGANLGNIEQDRFPIDNDNCVADILERLTMYIHDYFFSDMEEKVIENIGVDTNNMSYMQVYEVYKEKYGTDKKIEALLNPEDIKIDYHDIEVINVTQKEMLSSVEKSSENIELEDELELDY